MQSLQTPPPMAMQSLQLDPRTQGLLPANPLSSASELGRKMAAAAGPSKVQKTTK